jgi:hypothetical protein
MAELGVMWAEKIMTRSGKSRVEGTVVVLVRLEVEMVGSKGCRAVGAGVGQNVGGGVETISEGLGVGGRDLHRNKCVLILRPTLE